MVGTVRAARGACHWGHRAGDIFELSGHDTAGLCCFFYHDIFPYITMLQFGDRFPEAWSGPDSVELEHMDRTNAAKIELGRVAR